MAEDVEDLYGRLAVPLLRPGRQPGGRSAWAKTSVTEAGRETHDDDNRAALLGVVAP